MLGAAALVSWCAAAQVKPGLQLPDTASSPPDTSVLPLVTSVVDTVVGEPDSTRAQDIHPQDSPVDRGFLIRTSDGSAELRIRGSVRLNGILDFKGLQNQSTFSTYEIPVGEENSNETRFQMNAGQTRLGVEATRKAGFGDIFVKVETDFLGLSNSLRLRHGYATVYGFLFGQTWSTFADITAIPLTVDLDGPNGSVNERTVQIRYSNSLADRLNWDLSIESPNLEMTSLDTTASGPAYQSFPDIIGRVRKWGEWGHVQIAGVLRSISTKALNEHQKAKAGYGFLLSGRFYLGGGAPHRILFQFVAGKAISRYIGTLARKGLDVFYDPATGEPDLVPAMGGYLSYARQWTPHILSYVTGGFVRLGEVAGQAGDAFHFSRYVSGNIFWDATPGTRVGAEYSWGYRQNKDGAHGTASRFSFILMYDF